MRKEEFVKKNISLAFDFLRYLVDHPELVEELPSETEKDSPQIETEIDVEGVEKTFLRVEHSFNIAT